MPVFRGGNPAVELYQFWDDLLPDNTVHGAWNRYGISMGTHRYVRPFAWGAHDWALIRVCAHENRDSCHAIALGRQYRQRGKLYPQFALLADGRFAMSYVHGSTNRTSLGQATFLAPGWVASRNRWSVHPSLSRDTLWGQEVDVRPHISCNLSIRYGFRCLWQLTVDGPANGWRIGPADNQELPFEDAHPRPFSLDSVRQAVATEERQRLKRLARVNGVPRVLKEKPNPDFLKQIVAALDTSQPARNVPHIKYRTKVGV